jgi:hypothetical protein
MQPHVVNGALPWLYSLPPVDGQHSQEARTCSAMFQFCRNQIDCDDWSITAYAFIHQTCMATKLIEDKQKSDHLAVQFFTHLFKMLQSFPAKQLHGTSSQYGIPSDHISRWHLVEHTPSILNAPTFCIHFNWMPFPKKTSESNPRPMICSCAYLPSSSATKPAHAFSTPIKKVAEFSCTGFCCTCQNSCSAFCPYPHFTCSNINAFQLTKS